MSVQYANLLLFWFFFPFCMTILFILFVRKDKNSNFHPIVSIKCYNLLFIFLGFCFGSSQVKEKVAAKFLDVSFSQLFIPCIISFNFLCSFSFQLMGDISHCSTFCLFHNLVVRRAPVILTHSVFPELAAQALWSLIVLSNSVTMK